MSDRSDVALEIERSQRIMEYGIGVMVPAFLSMMLFSLILFDDIWPLFMALAVLTAVGMIAPATRIHDLSYRCWTKNTWPRTLVTGAMGLIYITSVSVFAIAMLSMYEGLDPEKPLTFGVAAALVVSLIVVMAYHDKYKDRYEKMDRRLVKMPHSDAHDKVSEVLTTSGHQFAVSRNGTSSHIDLSSHGLTIDLRPISSSSTAIIMEVGDGANLDVLDQLKSDFSFQ